MLGKRPGPRARQRTASQRGDEALRAARPASVLVVPGSQRVDAETERDAARADREQADDTTAQAITRMEEFEREQLSTFFDS